MSMWADYINECGILNILEQDFGWVTYHLDAPDIIINDCYVRPEFRRAGRARWLVDYVERVGRQYDCSRILCGVHKESLAAEGTEAALLRAGFRLQGEKENLRIFEREIGG